MSIESLGLWGCARDGALDVWNSARTAAYIKNCGRHGALDNCAPDVTPYLTTSDDPNGYVIQGGGGNGVPAVYTTPANDNAWWYDQCRPESAGFYGLEVLRVTGLMKNTRTQDVTVNPNSGCSTGLIYADPVDKGYEIVVEGILHGATCCSVRYGYLALKKALRGCCGGTRCSGGALRYIPCVPTSDLDALSLSCGTDALCDLPVEDSNSANAVTAVGPMRFVKNARVLDEPEVTKGEPDGMSCPNRCGCSPDTWVSFTLRAESGQYTCTKALIDTTLEGTDHCVTDISLCSCETTDPLDDPDCSRPTIPPPPNAASSCFCPIFTTDRKTVNFTLPPSLFDYQLEFKITTGSGPLRNFRVALWKRYSTNLFMDSGLYDKCNQCAGFGLTPLPAGTTWETSCGGISVTTPGRSPVNGSRTMLSVSGIQSNACVRLSCGEYILGIYSDPNNTPADARIQVSYRYVEP